MRTFKIHKLDCSNVVERPDAPSFAAIYLVYDDTWYSIGKRDALQIFVCSLFDSGYKATQCLELLGDHQFAGAAPAYNPADRQVAQRQGLPVLQTMYFPQVSVQ